MTRGDTVRNKNSESGELGLFVGLTTFVNQVTGEKYICAEVYWPHRGKIGTIQTNLIEKVGEAA
jgi:hypothetical protein